MSSELADSVRLTGQQEQAPACSCLPNPGHTAKSQVLVYNQHAFLAACVCGGGGGVGEKGKKERTRERERESLCKYLTLVFISLIGLLLTYAFLKEA